MSLEEEQDLEQAFVMPTFARKPLALVEGRGMRVYDSTGKEYLDFIAGIGVVSLGHCHPAVSQAIADQAQKLIHVGNYYYIENRGELAQTISSLLNKGPEASGASQGAASAQEEAAPSWKTFFANSGAEANECAIKLARKYAKSCGRDASLVISLKKSFHGRTLATLSATGQASKQDTFKPLLEGFIHVGINDIQTLTDVFERQGEHICAVLVECVQGEGGVHPCTKEFLQAAEELASKNDALLICDEIQTGIYRCGTYPFAFQHFDIHPDIVTIAKGVASGFPTGMCSAIAEVADAFEPGDHGSTFGGSSLAVTASYATLSSLQELEIGAHVEEMGVYLRSQLETLPQLQKVRGLGLMCGCDVCNGLSAPALVDKALDQGLLINATGPETLRFLPPLICQKEDIDCMIETLRMLLEDEESSASA